MRVALALALCALFACGDDSKKQDPDGMPDAGMDPTPDAMPDAPSDEELTLTGYVLDLIGTQTTGTAAPRPYAEFSSLPDPDGANNNLTAYQSLF